MKRHTLLITILACYSFSSCSGSVNEERRTLQATDFQQKIEELSDEQILDVRTVEEFGGGHIPNAVNVDWNSADFEKRVATLDKNAPVMVYCHSGGRSAEAAEKLQNMGFATIYEMEGGMLKWGRQGLPTITDNTNANFPQNPGMTKAEFDKLIKSANYVLVDFYADWCKPCKEMEPMLKKLAVDEKGNMEVVRINTDQNEELTQLMGVDALPTLMLYRKGKRLWSKVGLTDKAEIMKQIH